MDLKNINIQVWEMFVIVVAVLTFRRFWQRKRISIETDSQANIASVARGACNNKLVHQLIKTFTSVQILGKFSARLIYINTHDNKWADALSRGDIKPFTSEAENPVFIKPIFLPDFLTIA